MHMILVPIKQGNYWHIQVYDNGILLHDTYADAQSKDKVIAELKRKFNIT